MPNDEFKSTDGWIAKFANAFRGVRLGVQGQSSFAVHFLMLLAVLVAAILFRLDRTQWCLILLCCGLVLTAELFNSGLETMAKTIDRNENPELGQALDIASGAVLMAALFAAIVGLVVFLPQLLA